MSETAKLQTLLSEIEKSRSVLNRICGFYEDCRTSTHDFAGRTTEQSIVIADILVSYYTCLETILHLGPGYALYVVMPRVKKFGIPSVYGRYLREKNSFMERG